MKSDDAGLIDGDEAPELAELAGLSEAAFVWDPARRAPVWANDAALALWRSHSMADFARRAGKPVRMEARQLAHIASSLAAGAQRLERLRVTARGAQASLTCLCRWMTLRDQSYLIVQSLTPVPGFAPAAGGAQPRDAAGDRRAGGPENPPAGAPAPDMPVSGDGASTGAASGGDDSSTFTFEPTWDLDDDRHGDDGNEDDGNETEETPAVFAATFPTGISGKPRGMIVPFKGVAPSPREENTGLEAHEHDAFRAIAQALGARMEEDVIAERAALDFEAAGDSGRDLASGSGRSARFGADAGVLGDDALSILDRLHAGLLLFHGDTALFANRSFLDMFGFTGFDELAETGDIASLLPQLNDTVADPQGGPGAAGDPGDGAALVARRNTGETFPVTSRLQAVRWAGDTAMLLSVQKIHAGETRGTADMAPRTPPPPAIGAMIELAPFPVFAIADDGIIVEANAGARRLFAPQRGEAVTGRALQSLLTPDSAEPFASYLDAFKSGHEGEPQGNDFSGNGVELRAAPLGAAEFPVLVALEKIAGTEFMAVVLRDLSKWKSAEAELARAREAAERQSALKSDFIAQISHEIRTPLNSVIGFSQMMLRAQFGPLGHEKYHDYAQAIHDSGAHVLGLVNDLLDLSKIEAGKLELNFTAVNLNEVVGQAIKTIQPEAGRARVITRLSLAPHLPAIVADHRSLMQICLNLLSNAIKFTPAGGQTVISTLVNDRGEVLVRVRDTGIGMSRDEIRWALEPFHQIAPAANSNQRGTGLGLPLIKALAEANRARFSIDSNSGKGTLTEVAFPAARVLGE